jgi:hypothetical protein
MDLPSCDLSSFDENFTNEEVQDTIKESSDKALGTDGFTGLFFKSCLSNLHCAASIRRMSRRCVVVCKVEDTH